jgi:2,5-diketo-D-gluconate reductase A
MADVAQLAGFPRMTMGTMMIPPEQTVAAVHRAIELGYRSFDASPVYGNEPEVGEAIRTSPLARGELFVTTKLWNASHGYDEALAAFERTAQRLQLEVVDLYLIHWPVPTVNRYVESWKALVRLQAEGRIRAIGVSNFLPEHLARIVDATGVVPAVNQIELNPSFQQADMREHHRQLGILTQAWSPFGHGGDLADPKLSEIARAKGRSPAQVILRWLLQLGVHPVAKAGSAGHMAENLQASAFELSASDMAQIAALDRGTSCFGLDPNTFVAPEGMEDLNP